MTEHYYSKKQTSALVKRRWAIDIGGRVLQFETASGTFSPRKLDLGTKALLDSMQLPPEGSVLDLGCGNGMVGIAAAAENAKLHVVLSDVNSRAVMEAKSNIKRNRLKNAVALQSDLFEKITEKFDCILSNPPISAGKSVVFAMVAQGFANLDPGGSLQMVARSKKGGASISKEMGRVFGNVEVIAKQSGFSVYKSVKQE